MTDVQLGVDGLRCVDTVGNGFTLARSEWKILGTGTAAEGGFRWLQRTIQIKAARIWEHEVLRVSAPRFIGGTGCGKLQEAAVTVDFVGSPPSGIFFVCYVSGRWLIESGPVFGE